MPHQQILLADLQTHLRNRWDNSGFWSATEEIFLLNEALRVWNVLTGMWKKRVTLPTVANQVYYSVPSSLVHSVKMTWNEYTLAPSSLHEMDMGRPGWEAHTTATGGSVPTRPTTWIRVGVNTFAIWPADATADNAIVIDGTMATPTLALPGDYINIGQEELAAIIDYAVHIAGFKGDRRRWQGTFEGYKRFLLAAAKKNHRLENSAMFRHAMQSDPERQQVPIVN